MDINNWLGITDFNDWNLSSWKTVQMRNNSADRIAMRDNEDTPTRFDDRANFIFVESYHAIEGISQTFGGGKNLG